MNVTLTRVADEHREYDGKFGQMAVFKVWFDDDRIGEVTAKAENLARKRLEFESFIGKSVELIVEDGGKWADGSSKPLKVKVPQQQGFATAPTSSQGRVTSKKEYVPRYTDTEEGAHYVQERMDRRTALMQAVLVRAPEQADWMETAKRMYGWLREPLEAVVDTNSRAPSGGTAATVPSQPPEPATWGEVAADALGEGATAAASPPLTAAPPLPLDEPQLKATDEQWDRLRAVVGGSNVKAVNRLNKVNKTDYTQATAAEGATRAEVAAAITGEAP